MKDNRGGSKVRKEGRNKGRTKAELNMGPFQEYLS
jgi:hypothetical protein